MAFPLISIIVPVYNTAQYLSDTVKLLTEQTYKNIEIVLVDDGSTDNSPELCDSLAKTDSRIKVIHQKNSGVCAARNAGIEASSGEYIGFCDSDDMPHNDLYETLYNLIEENNADLSMVTSAIYFTNGKIIDNSDGKTKIFKDKEEILKIFLLNRMHTSVYTKLFSRELCSKISFPAPHRINEDKFYTFNAILNCKKLAYKNVCKYNYCRRAGSSSQENFSDKYLDIIYFANIIKDTIAEKYPELVKYAEINSVISNMRLSQLLFIFKGDKEYAGQLNSSLAYIKSVDPSLCKEFLPKNLYVKYRIAKLGKLPYKLSVKLFTKL